MARSYTCKNAIEVNHPSNPVNIVGNTIVDTIPVKAYVSHAYASPVTTAMMNIFPSITMTWENTFKTANWMMFRIISFIEWQQLSQKGWPSIATMMYAFLLMNLMQRSKQHKQQCTTLNMHFRHLLLSCQDLVCLSMYAITQRIICTMATIIAPNSIEPRWNLNVRQQDLQMGSPHSPSPPLTSSGPDGRVQYQSQMAPATMQIITAWMN
mmetsp:Transcript_20059/g.29503  ORF Transcript_20059/g.29503 Transcript_20059/m.29503 type:complete len:210 (-) Transcript_20059:657-1286(-)